MTLTTARPRATNGTCNQGGRWDVPGVEEARQNGFLLSRQQGLLPTTLLTRKYKPLPSKSSHLPKYKLHFLEVSQVCSPAGRDGPEDMRPGPAACCCMSTHVHIHTCVPRVGTHAFLAFVHTQSHAHAHVSTHTHTRCSMVFGTWACAHVPGQQAVQTPAIRHAPGKERQKGITA